MTVFAIGIAACAPSREARGGVDANDPRFDAYEAEPSVDAGEVPLRPSPIDASPVRAPEPAFGGTDVTFDDLILFDGSRTQQRWRVSRSGMWQLQSWVMLEPSQRRREGMHRYDPTFRPPVETPSPGCPTDMVRVSGSMLALDDYELLARQDDACTRWRTQDEPTDERCVQLAFRTERPADCPCLKSDFRQRHYATCICERFDRDAYHSDLARRPGPRHAIVPFCIDRYEYPDRAGAEPVISVTWTEASRLCAARGRRLCTEHEWTFACEGESALPFPTGYELDAGACNVSRAVPNYAPPAVVPQAPTFGAELARVWQGLPGGAASRCSSPFGVMDMAGNVDEWTRSNAVVDEATHRWVSILKGGYWGENLNRCRVSTRAHYQGFSYYQMGFRCCVDAAP